MSRRNTDNLSISSASSGSRTSPDSLGDAGENDSEFMRLVRWLLKPHEPSSTAGSKLKDAIRFFRRPSANSPTWRAGCRCFTAKPTEGYPEVVVCRQGLVKIRTRWCKEHKDLDRFRPPERNPLCPVWLFVLP